MLKQGEIDAVGKSPRHMASLHDARRVAPGCIKNAS
jgi:hypothetical protein